MENSSLDFERAHFGWVYSNPCSRVSLSSKQNAQDLRCFLSSKYVPLKVLYGNRRGLTSENAACLVASLVSSMFSLKKWRAKDLRLRP